MRIFLAAVLLALLIPASAGAAGYTVIPPSNSGADQYRESIPTAGGNNAATAVVTDASGLSSRLGAGSPISAATRAALIRQGRDGRKVARLTRVTAPSIVRHPQPPAGVTDPATGAVVGALTGLDGSGGLGAGLPVVLALSAVVAIVVGVRRRRAG